MSFVKNLFLGLIISVFVLIFTAFVLISSAQTSFLNSGFVVNALDQSNVSSEAYKAVPQLASVVSEQQFTESFKKFISDLINYLNGTQNEVPKFMIPNSPVNLSLDSLIKSDSLTQTRGWIVLLNSSLPLLMIAGIVILFVLLIFSGSLKEKIETMQKTFFRAGISMLISSVIAYALLTFSGNNLFPDSQSLAMLSKFLSILLNQFLITSIILALIPTLLSVVLFFAGKQFAKSENQN